jgi:hypothetical protein
MSRKSSSIARASLSLRARASRRRSRAPHLTCSDAPGPDLGFIVQANRVGALAQEGLVLSRSASRIGRAGPAHRAARRRHATRARRPPLRVRGDRAAGVPRRPVSRVRRRRKMPWAAGRHNSGVRSLDKHGRLKTAGLAAALWQHAAPKSYPRSKSSQAQAAPCAYPAQPPQATQRAREVLARRLRAIRMPYRGIANGI